MVIDRNNLRKKYSRGYTECIPPLWDGRLSKHVWSERCGALPSVFHRRKS